jgi:putative sigma-54 modulation protein
MKVRVRWKGTDRSRAVEDHLMRRLLFAVGRLAERVHAVRAWFEDVNGPRGGVDKRCAIEIHGALGVRRVEVRDADFYAAVDRAVHAAARTLARDGARRAAHRVRALVPHPLH